MSGSAVLFEAVITPHRSLSPRGLRVLIAVLCCASLLITSLFSLLGAWPVAGFNGAEIGLAVVLLRLNVRMARQSELVLLTMRDLRIVRTGMDGQRSERVLDPAWLSARLEEKPGRIPRLLLSVRGQEEEIARQLGEDEKRDLARALAAALHRMRNPVFDNPQLN